MKPITACGAEMDQLMEVSIDDVQAIEQGIEDRVNLGVPKMKAQVMAVQDAIALVDIERNAVMKAIEEQIAQPQYSMREYDAFNIDSFSYEEVDAGFEDDFEQIGNFDISANDYVNDLGRIKPAAIKAAGLMPESLFPSPTFVMGEFGDLVAQFKTGKERFAVSIEPTPSGTEFTPQGYDLRQFGRGFPVGTYGVNEESATEFARKAGAMIHIQKSGFDLMDAVDAEAAGRIREYWSNMAKVPGALELDAEEERATGDAAKSLEKVAKSRLKGRGITFEASPEGQSIEIKIKQGNNEDVATLENVGQIGGRESWVVHSLLLTKGSGVGKQLYSVVATWAKQRNAAVVADDNGLTMVNSVRRTENAMSSAARTGGESNFIPGIAQRVYGFNQKEPEKNLVRLALAQLRNVLEVAPEVESLRYDAEAGTFSHADPLKKSSVPALVRRILARKEVRDLSIGRSSIARAALTNQLTKEKVATPASVISPVLYSMRQTSEYQDVEARYKGTSEWMMAPNGKPTKLTETQWVQVRTPSFQSWFGPWEKFASLPGGVWNDSKGEVSKAVDENGEPLVVYHGTDNAGFMAFTQPGGEVRGDIGIFTTPDFDMARSYVKRNRVSLVEDRLLTQEQADEIGYQFEESSAGVEVIGPDGYAVDGPAENDYIFKSMADALRAISDLEQSNPAPGVYALFANIRTPYETDFEGAGFNGARVGQYVVEVDGDIQYSNGKAYFDNHIDAQAFADEVNGVVEFAPPHYETTDGAAREGIRSGDGAVIRNVIDDGGGPSNYMADPRDVFVLKDPNQVKSATFNSGIFGESDDIRYSSRQDPVIGDRTDVSKLPKGKAIPDSVGVGGLQSVFEMAGKKKYQRGRDLKIEIQDAVTAAAKAAKVSLTTRTQNLHKFLSDMVYKDALHALKTNANAVGWYDTKVSQALNVLATLHPEIKTEPESRLAFVWALAVTSNGLKVDKNFELAEKAYSQWKQSADRAEDRVMPVGIGVGNAAKQINEGLDAFNTVTRRMGFDAASRFMVSEMAARDVEFIAGKKPSGEWADVKVTGASILGPKIGNGFYANLNGYFDSLTMDRWLMRTFGRLTGTLIDLDPAEIRNKRDGLKKAIAAMTPEQLATASGLIGQRLSKSMAVGAMDEIAAAINKATLDKEKREALQSSPELDRFRLDGRSLVVALDGQKEAPSGPAERNWIRAIFATALEKLSASGNRMTMADLQALLWYPERRVYDTAKSKDEAQEGYEDDDAPDYANAAVKLVTDKGVSQEDAKKAMADAKGTKRTPRMSSLEQKRLLTSFLFEAAPDPANVDAMTKWGSMTPVQREKASKKAMKDILPAVAEAVGIKAPRSRMGMGGFMGQVNHSVHAEYAFDALSLDQAETLAAAIGYVLDQASVVLTDSRLNSPVNLIRFNFSDDPSAHTQQIYDAIRNAIPEMDGFSQGGKNIDVLNFTGIPNEDIVNRLGAALESLNLPIKATIEHEVIQSKLVERNEYESRLVRSVRPTESQDRGGVPRALRDLRQSASELVFGRPGLQREGTRGVLEDEGNGYSGDRQSDLRGAVNPSGTEGEMGAAGPAGRGRGRGQAQPANGQAGDAELATGVPGQVRQAAAGDISKAGARDGGSGRAEGNRVSGGAADAGRKGNGQYSQRLTPLQGVPSKDPIKAGTTAGPDARLVSVAEAYAKANGIALRRQSEYVDIDPDRSKRLADAYAAMPHAPSDPAVKEAYQNLIRQTEAQYRALEAAGYKFWLFGNDNDPYAGNPWAAMADLRENQVMAVYSTVAGFGTDATFDPKDNPLLADTGIKWPSGSPTGPMKPVLANDLFRAVHDAFGHGLEGAGFRARGEENAWQAHVRLFTGSAVAAITSETRGQNSWLNFGPSGESNQSASVFDTDFAQQKTGLLPAWTWTEGLAGDQTRYSARIKQTETPEFKKWFGDSKVVDADGKPLVVYHGTQSDFAKFQESDDGIYFAGRPDAASAYAYGPDGDGEAVGPSSGANVTPVYLSLQNPLVVTDEWLDAFAGVAPKDPFKRGHSFRDDFVDSEVYARKAVVAEAKRLGHDGMILPNDMLPESVMGGDWSEQPAYVAFNPAQIKSAIGNNGSFDGANPDIRHSARDPIGFYSELSNKVSSASMNQAPAQAWKTFIKALTQKGVKQDEIEWSGVMDWLDAQEGKIKREQVVQYLDANGVKVNEVVLGAPDYEIVQGSVESFERIHGVTVRYEIGEGITEMLDGDGYRINDYGNYLGKSGMEDMDYLDDIIVNGRPTDVRYDKYTLPGGENYREVLLTLPVPSEARTLKDRYRLNDLEESGLADSEEAKSLREKRQDAAYQSSHWDQPNVLAHIRVNDRTDADGNKVLFVEELQSDWSADGRKKGFQSDKTINPTDAEIREYFGLKDGADPADYRQEMIDRERRIAKNRGVPSAPFVTKTDGWLNLALKRIIAMAVDGGYDSVAFVNGEQSADRYDLSKSIESIGYDPKTGRLQAYDKSRMSVIDKTGVSEDQLEDYIGKEVAQRLLATEPMMGKHLLDGEQIKVGGEGMKTFYDSIVPNAVKALLKKVGGGQMRTVGLMMGDQFAGSRKAEYRKGEGIFVESRSTEERIAGPFDTYNDAAKWMEENPETLPQPGFDITPEMASQVQKGLPQFSARISVDGVDRPLHDSNGKRIHQSDDGVADFWKWFGDSKVVDKDGKPLVVYHGTGADIASFAPEKSADGVFHFAIDSAMANRFSVSRAKDGVRGANVMPVYLSIKNPKRVSFINTMEINAAKAEGYDGLISDSRGHIVAFDPTQIKSAIGNNGDFNGENPDIRYSRRAGTSNWDEPIPSKFDDLLYKFQDKLIDLKRVIQDITKWTGKLADDVNVYLQEELFHGRAAKRVQDFVSRELTPALKELSGYGMTLADIEEYLHARHAVEANRVIAQRNPGVVALQDGGSGMTNADARQYMASLSQDEAQKLASVAAKFDAIMAETNQMRVAYGLESQDAINAWGRMFNHYIPLYREDKDGGRGIGQGFSVRGKETKGRTGSTRKVVDIVAHIAQARENTIVRGEKNRVSTALVGLVKLHPNPDFWRVGPPPKERVYNPDTGLVEERVDPLYKSRDNVVISKTINANGQVEEVAVTFNEDNERAMRLASALKNLDAGNLEGLWGTFASVSRYFAAINTQYNPVFGVVNLVRDIQGAMFNLGTTPLAGKKGKISKDAIQALWHIYSDLRASRNGGQSNSPWAQIFEQFQEDGGQTGFRQLFETAADRTDDIRKTVTPDAWMETLFGKVVTANGALKMPAGAIKKGSGVVFDWLSDYNEAMENAIRVSAYKNALDSGLTREQAASLAKNLTVNFNRKGQMSMQAGALYAFFNAAIQGSTRLAETLFTMEPGQPKTIRLSPLGKKIVYGGMLFGSMQALVLAGAGFGENEPPEFVRERSIVIPVGGKDYVSIPMPLGLHVIPGLGRHATELALSGFKDPTKRLFSVAGMMADAFNPIGNAGLSMQTLTPTAFDPLVALTENRDWTGKPIARTSFNKDVPGFTQHKDSATYIAKLMAEGINFLSGGNKYVAGVLSPTPDQIDYLIGQVTGGVGRELSKVEQTTLGAITGEEVPIYKVPLVGRFVGSASGQGGESNAFYANTGKLNRLETEIKGLEKDGKKDEARELKRQPEAYLIAQANAAEREIQKLRKQKREMVANDAPREQVRQIEDRITATMSRLNRAVEARAAS